MSEHSKIAVVIRARPMRDEERGKGEGWDYNSTSMTMKGNQDIVFNFEHVHSPTTMTSELYEKTVKSRVIEKVCSGISGCVFAYGQTGSGKSYTMFGDCTEAVPGLVQLSVRDLFNFISRDQTKEYIVMAGVLEIYNEKILDLLASDEKLKNNTNEVTIMDSYGQNLMRGCRRKIISGLDDVLRVTRECLNERRKTADTLMNAHSSRSHCMVRLDIEIFDAASRGKQARLNSMKLEDGFVLDDGKKLEGVVYTKCTLNLVDLAGSENAKKSGTAGDKVKQGEGKAINTSLSALVGVIKTLNEIEKGKKDSKSSFVSYRSSKLTRLLQDSLGGNSCTAIICNIATCSDHVEETKSTLQFASNAKEITHQVHAVEVGGRVNEKELAVANAEIASLKTDLSNLDAELQTVTAERDALQTENDQLRSKEIENNQLIDGLEEQFEKDQDTIKLMEAECDRYEAHCRNLQEQLQKANAAVEDLQRKLADGGVKLSADVQQPGTVAAVQKQDSAHARRIEELEEQIRSRDAQRDMIIDNKLKRMQELVLRLYKSNRLLRQTIHTACKENSTLKQELTKVSKKHKVLTPTPDAEHIVQTSLGIIDRTNQIR